MILAETLCSYLDEYLCHGDYSGDMSQNGLQVEGEKEINKIAVAVDARYETFRRAVDAKADLLLCHHGLFWGRSELLRGHHFRRIKLLIESGMGLYASHLPLDAHPEVGNNAVIAKELKLKDIEPWAMFRGQTVGMRGSLARPKLIQTFVKDVEKLLAPFDGSIQLFGQGKRKIQHIGLVSGDAANELPSAAADGLDVLLTGEPSHVFAMLVDELETYLVCGGHYATETFGVRALAAHIEEKFNIETEFIHAPTFA